MTANFVRRPMTLRLKGAPMALVILAVLLFAALPARAINKYAGTSGAQFLKLGAGSRAGAMAEAYSAVCDDVYALYYNPGALTNLTGSQLAASHTEHFQGINYEFAGFAIPWARQKDYSRHALGVAIYNLSVGDIERRSEDTPNSIGNFDAGDYSYNLTYAYRPDRKLGFGVTGKLIQQTIDSYKSDAVAADLGLLYRPQPDAKRPYALSLVVKNWGTRPSFAGVSDPLPLGLTAGFGVQALPKKLKVALDITKYRDTDVFGALGGEYLHPFNDDIAGALRMGFTSHYRENPGLNELTLGAGLNFHRATFDFAWVPFGNLGNTFRYSLLIRF